MIVVQQLSKPVSLCLGVSCYTGTWVPGPTHENTFLSGFATSYIKAFISAHCINTKHPKIWKFCNDEYGAWNDAQAIVWRSYHVLKFGDGFNIQGPNH